MTDLNGSRSPEFLRERVSYLEESNRRLMSILELLASSSEFQGDLSRARDGVEIFRATGSQLRRLFSFKSMGFLECQSDGSFELVVADPVETQDGLKALVEVQMMDGTFAWALNRNQAVLVPTECGETLLLQVVATQSRIRGMFAGTLPGRSAVLDVASLNALSIVLYTAAYALESTVLYGMLRDHSQHLEERVRIRTHDLEEARRLAEAASLAKSDFLANMSHEIRTPMNGVLGMTELLLQGGNSPQREKTYLRAIKDSADCLMLIINDILDFSKIESGKFTLEQVSFSTRDLVGRCLDGLSVSAEQKGLRLMHRIDPAVPSCLVGDSGRLRQVLTNLVGNAIKFCHEGEIFVAVGLSAQGTDEVVLAVSVTDTGIGIDEEACRRIFNQFEQADNSTTRKFGGTGLGLAICKKLVELMDGAISVESRLGEGSCFNFTARFQVGSEEAPLPEQEAPVAVSCFTPVPLEILLADDVEINRVLVQAILKPTGYRITCVENGRAALEACQARRFDVVLMDIQMPELDGLQATRAIRQYERSRGETEPVTIIAMTAFAGNEDRQVCLDAGMNDYLVKPIKPAHLLQMLERCCRNPAGPVETPRNSAPDVSMVPAAPADSGDGEVIFAQSELLERLGGHSEIIPRFVGLFCKGAVPQIEGVGAALAAGDVDGVRRCAHAIKGAAGNISALRVQQTAAIIERAAKDNDLAELPQLYARLQLDYGEFTAAVVAGGFAVEPQLTPKVE